MRQRVLKDEYDVWDIWILVRFLERRRVLQDDFLVVEETSEIFGRIGGTHVSVFDTLFLMYANSIFLPSSAIDTRWSASATTLKK